MTNPRISILSLDSYFVDTIIVESSNMHMPGSKYVSWGITRHEYLLFNFNISIALRDYGDSLNMPLYVRITSPNKVSQHHLLEEDIFWLQLDDIYHYNFEIRLVEFGWFTIELVSGQSQIGLNNDDTIIVFDKSYVYFRN